MNFKLYRSADLRLDEIWEYTLQKWDEEQADKYITGLFETFESLPEIQHKWRHAKFKSHEGIYFVRFKRHYIFFKLLQDEKIGIFSILHENMDIPFRLDKDLEESS